MLAAARFNVSYALGRKFQNPLSCAFQVLPASGSPRVLLLPGLGPILRLQRFLVDEARRDLTTRAERLSGVLGRPFRSLHVRDTKSRWGSCSSRAGLNFSENTDAYQAREARVVLVSQPDS